MVAGRLVAMVKRARIVKSEGGICGRCFLQCGQDYRREHSSPEHASDIDKAPGGHVGGCCRYCFSTGPSLRLGASRGFCLRGRWIGSAGWQGP